MGTDTQKSKSTERNYGSVFRKAKEMSKKSESKTELVELKKEIGLLNGVGIIIGVMIGSGIFVSPGSVVRYSGSIGMSLIVWVVTGFMSIVGALCYAELGTMIPKSGGDYTYLLEVFGPIPAFVTLWISIVLSGPAGRAISLITFATYLLQPLFQDCDTPPFWAVRLFAIALLGLLGYINCVGVKTATSLQNTLTLMKLFSLVMIIFVGVYHLAQGNVQNYSNPMEGTITNPSSIATAFYSTLFAYSGWNTLNSMTEELRNPNKNLPWAIALSLGTVTVIYVLTNLAYFAVLTPTEILSSGAVAVTFGNRTFGILAWVISIFVAFSTFGSMNGGTFAFSRVIYVAARERQLPRCLSFIHVHNHTPVPAIISTIILPAFMLLAPDLDSVVAYTSFTENMVSLLCVLALLWLRYKEPDRERPLKVWIGFPILYLILSLFVAVFPIVRRPVEIGVAAGAFLVGLMFYYFTIHRKIQFLDKLMDKVTYLCQMVFLSVEEEKSI